MRFEDGTVALDLGRVVYVLVEDEEHRVGFRLLATSTGRASSSPGSVDTVPA